MKKKFVSFVFLSSLLLFVSSCSEQSQSTRVAPGQEQQLSESQIINIMMTVDKGEIAASQTATENKVSPLVDSYAKYLIQQHQRNLEELTKLAQQWELKPQESAISNSLVDSGKQDRKALEKLQGQALDKAYIDTMIKEHQEGLDLIDTKLLPQANNSQLKIIVEHFRHMVSEHLENGLEVQRTLNS